MIWFKKQKDFTDSLDFFRREAVMVETFGPRAPVKFLPLARMKLTGRYDPRMGCIDYYGAEVRIIEGHLN